MQIIEVSSWANWKTLLRANLVLMQYFDTGTTYNMYLPDPQNTMIVYHYNLFKDGGADQIDFDTNYKDIRYARRDFYSASMVAGVSPATPTDVFTITGSATKIVKIWSLSFGGTKTTAGMIDVVYLKRSSANAGGTSSTRTVVPHDANSPAGTAVVRHYTVNPATPGTLIGNLCVRKIALGGTAGVVTNVDVLQIQNPCVLDGVAQVFAINLNGVTQAGNNLDMHITWSEE